MFWKAVPTQEVTSLIFLCYILFRMFRFSLTLRDTCIFFTRSFQLVFPNFAITEFQNERNTSFLLLRLVHVWLGDDNGKLQGKKLLTINLTILISYLCIKSAICLLGTQRSLLLSRGPLVECKLMLSVVLFISCRKYVGKLNMPLRYFSTNYPLHHCTGFLTFDSAFEKSSCQNEAILLSNLLVGGFLLPENTLLKITCYNVRNLVTNSDRSSTRHEVEILRVETFLKVKENYILPNTSTHTNTLMFKIFKIRILTT
jgi:hypothetical protein